MKYVGYLSHIGMIKSLFFFFILSVPLQPYGISAGDTELPRTNDMCSQEIDLPLGLPIHGNIMKAVYVNDVLLFI